MPLCVLLKKYVSIWREKAMNDLSDGVEKDEIDLPRLEKGKYLHCKSGKFYEVIGVALQTETGEAMVVYRPLYKHPKYTLFVRPFDVFTQMIECDGASVPRFQKV